MGSIGSILKKIEEYKKSKKESQYGVFLKELSTNAQSKIGYLLANKKLASNFKSKMKKYHINPKNIEEVMVHIKPLPYDKYQVTLFFFYGPAMVYQFTTDYEGLIDFIQNT